MKNDCKNTSLYLRHGVVEIDGTQLDVTELSARDRANMIELTQSGQEQHALITVAVLGCAQLQTGDFEADIDAAYELPARAIDAITQKILELSGLSDEEGNG